MTDLQNTPQPVAPPAQIRVPLHGTYARTLDRAGRMVLPPAQREDVAWGRSAIAAPGGDGCVYVYPTSAWQSMVSEYAHLKGYVSEEAHQKLLWVFGNAFSVSIDPKDRVALPDQLLAMVGLAPGQDVMSVGAMDHLEVWSPEGYRSFRGTYPGGFEKAVRTPTGPESVSPGMNPSEGRGSDEIQER